MNYHSVTSSGFFVELGGPGESAPSTYHAFCGVNDTSGATCPNCAVPLLRFWLLDRRDERLQISHQTQSYLPLLFCWRCEVSQAPLTYRALDRGVELLSYGVGGPESDFPYPAYPASFPAGNGTLVPIDAETQTTITGVNTGTIDENWLEREVELRCARVRHQFGGEPYLIQSEREPGIVCQECDKPMPFLASVADQSLDPRGFTGNFCVQVLYFFCRSCDVVTAIQRSD